MATLLCLVDGFEANTPDEFFTIMSKRDELQPGVAALELEYADYESDTYWQSSAAAVREKGRELRRSHRPRQVLRLAGQGVRLRQHWPQPVPRAGGRRREPSAGAG